MGLASAPAVALGHPLWWSKADAKADALAQWREHCRRGAGPTVAVAQGPPTRPDDTCNVVATRDAMARGPASVVNAVVAQGPAAAGDVVVALDLVPWATLRWHIGLPSLATQW